MVVVVLAYLLLGILSKSEELDLNLTEGAWVTTISLYHNSQSFLYTTNKNRQVVNLNEVRDFSNNKKIVYVFKKFKWGSSSIDMLPYPDTFTDALTSSSNATNSRDDDGAKRLFFGGERFLKGISRQAYITVQRTKLNNPLGLEVQLHITEVVCPALSELESIYRKHY